MRISSRDKIRIVFVKIEDAGQLGGGVYLGTFGGILVGRIAGRDKVCGRVAEIEVAILHQNVDGDVEGYVIGCLVGMSIGVSEIENIVSSCASRSGRKYEESLWDMKKAPSSKNLVGMS